MRAWAGVILLIGGCGFSEERFLVKGVDRWCDLSAECAGTFEKDACIDVFRSTDREGCTYDSVSAADCFAELPDAECLEDELLGLSTLEVPESCELVYDCPEE